MATGDKTEAATPKRREDAKKKGNVPRSTELSSVLALLAGVLVLKSIGTTIFVQVFDLMGSSFGNLTSEDWTVTSISSYGGAIGALYLNMMAPLFATIMVVGVASNFLQSGLVITAKPLLPDFSRADPFKGLQRIVSSRSLVELFKSVAKLGIVGFVVYQTFQENYLQMLSLTGGDVRGAASVIAAVGSDILVKAGVALLVVAAADYGYQRWEYEKNIRMTKEEIKEELRESEGDPKIRSRIRQQQRQMASKRMMQDVPQADVIITNPTHLAVALQYRPESMRSPKVTAKGQLLVAERIKEVARQHGIPVLENKPLARALFKSVEVGGEIPPQLYHAVAEILAFVYSLKRARRLGGQSIGG